MSVPAEVLQKILLQQQEQLNLIATLTQKFQVLDTGVAERISYFCLVCNLSRPLGSTHNFTQSG